MEKSKVVKKEIDEFDWMLESYGRKRFENEKKQCREEGRVEGRVETSESIALNMLTSNYPPEEISKLTKLDLATIHQLAKNNNL